MYRDTIRKPDTHPDVEEIKTSSSEPNSKINHICEAFLKVLTEKPKANLQNIITVHVCKSPPDLDGGLLIISKLKGKSKNSLGRI
jgi:elongator complex protein 1